VRASTGWILLDSRYLQCTRFGVSCQPSHQVWQEIERPHCWRSRPRSPRRSWRPIAVRSRCPPSPGSLAARSRGPTAERAPAIAWRSAERETWSHTRRDAIDSAGARRARRRASNLARIPPEAASSPPFARGRLAGYVIIPRRTRRIPRACPRGVDERDRSGRIPRAPDRLAPRREQAHHPVDREPFHPSLLSRF